MKIRFLEKKKSGVVGDIGVYCIFLLWKLRNNDHMEKV